MMSCDRRMGSLFGFGSLSVVQRRFAELLVWGVVVGLVNASHGADPQAWPEFRGPHGDGHALAEDQPPTKWAEPALQSASNSGSSRAEKTWKIPIHGRGWSSPVVSDGQIWLTTALPDGKEMYGVCVDFETGKIVHDIKLLDVQNPSFAHATNSYASPTPLIVGDDVILTFGSYGTFCLNRKTGQERWRRTDLPCDHFRGPGSSPIQFEQMMILHYDGFDFQYVVALDVSTGQTIWKQDRMIDYGTDDGDIMKAFSTPSIVSIEGQPQLISPTSKATLAYDPRSGKELWRIHYDQFSATARPLYGHGMFYLNSGFGKAELFAIDAQNLRGDVTNTHVKWHNKKQIGSKPSALLVDDLLLVVHDTGVLTCLDALTGEQQWTERLNGNFSGSPIFAGGHAYFCDEEGHTTVIRPARTYQLVATNPLGDGCMASPAVYKNSLILRTRSHLYRIGEDTDE